MDSLKRAAAIGNNLFNVFLHKIVKGNKVEVALALSAQADYLEAFHPQ